MIPTAVKKGSTNLRRPAPPAHRQSPLTTPPITCAARTPVRAVRIRPRVRTDDRHPRREMFLVKRQGRETRRRCCGVFLRVSPGVEDRRIGRSRIGRNRSRRSQSDIARGRVGRTRAIHRLIRRERPPELILEQHDARGAHIPNSGRMVRLHVHVLIIGQRGVLVVEAGEESFMSKKG